MGAGGTLGARAALTDPPEGGRRVEGRCQDPPRVSQDEDARGTLVGFARVDEGEKF